MKSKLVPAVVAVVALAALVALVLRGDGTRGGAAGRAAHAHTGAMLAFGPRPPDSAALARVREFLGTELARSGWETRHQPFTRFTPAGRIEFVNVRARHVGEAGGEGAWERPVRGLLAAHVDSKLYTDRRFLGADDAASAVALILVLAEELAADPDRARQLEIVFFDGEEAIGPTFTATDGIYGSRHYAAQLTRGDAKPDFGIVLDMVGHPNLRIAYPRDSPPQLEKVLLAAVAAEKVGGHFRRAPGPILDDHVPLNNAGVPTIDIIGDFANSTWWHTPRDNLDNVSAESLDITARVVRRMLGELLP